MTKPITPAELACYKSGLPKMRDPIEWEVTHADMRDKLIAAAERLHEVEAEIAHRIAAYDAAGVDILRDTYRHVLDLIRRGE